MNFRRIIAGILVASPLVVTVGVIALISNLSGTSLTGQVLSGGTCINGYKLTEYSIPTPKAESQGIVSDVNGNMWFTEPGADKIGKVTPAGVFTEYPLPAGSKPFHIDRATDGTLWFTETGTNKIGKITTAGVITHYAVPTASAGLSDIVAGPNGNLWFVEQLGRKIGRITINGDITEFPLNTIPSQSAPNYLTMDSGGNIWFADFSKIGKMTTSGVITWYSSATPGASIAGLVAGSDGNIWYTLAYPGGIGKITTSGVITEYMLPAGGYGGPMQIIRANDNKMWFTDTANAVGRITVNGEYTMYPIKATGTFPQLATSGIASDASDTIWFTQFQQNANKIGKLEACTAEPVAMLFTTTQYSANEGDGQATITLRRTGDISASSTIGYSTTHLYSAMPGASDEINPNMATPTTDYTVANGTATFAAGSSTTSFTINIVNDTIPEENELVVVILAAQPNINFQAALLTIVDNDSGGGGNTTVKFSQSGKTVSENVGTTSVGVTLNAASTSDVRVNYTMKNNTAAALQDYLPANGSLYIPQGQTSVNIPLVILNDSIQESSESLTIELSAPQGAALGTPSTITVTINDDDSGGVGSCDQTPDLETYKMGGVPTVNALVTGSDGRLWFTSYGVDSNGYLYHDQLTGFSYNGNLGNSEDIVMGPDGNFWYVRQGGTNGYIGKIAVADSVSPTLYEIPTSNAQPKTIIVGPDGNMWFTEFTAHKIGKITTSGVITEYPIPNHAIGSSFETGATGITTGPDGNLWYAHVNKVAKMTTNGDITEYSVPMSVVSIVQGPDGNLWAGGNGLYKITTSGVVTSYPFPNGSRIDQMVVGPDGNIWFRNNFNQKNIGKISMSGVMTTYDAPYGTLFTGWGDITVGPDNNIYFSHNFSVSGAIGRVNLNCGGGDSNSSPVSSTGTQSSVALSSVAATSSKKASSSVTAVSSTAATSSTAAFSSATFSSIAAVSSSSKAASKAGSSSSICAACSEACAERIAMQTPPKQSLLGSLWSNLTGQVTGGPTYSINNGNCVDADGGLNPLVAGETRDASGGRRADVCKDQFAVMEASCYSTPNAPMNTLVSVTCPTGTRCDTGACKPIPGWTPPANPTCAEPDGGADVAVGATTVGTKTQTDACEGNNMVHEYYCAQQNATTVVNGGMVVQCPSGSSCQNGACVAGATDSDWACDRCLAEECPAGDSCLPICGDGAKVAWEQCDDGNTESGDGCTAECNVETVCTQKQIDCFTKALITTGEVSFGLTSAGPTLMVVKEPRAPASIDAALAACNMQPLMPGNFDDEAIRAALGAREVAEQPPVAYVQGPCTAQQLKDYRDAGVAVLTDADCAQSAGVMGYGNWVSTDTSGAEQQVYGVADKHFAEQYPAAVCTTRSFRFGSSSSAASFNSSSLGPNKHLACSSNKCVVQDGAGPNTCSSDTDCSGSMSSGASSSNPFEGCPADACSGQGGDAFCQAQGKTCAAAAWPDCIQCKGDNVYDCSTQNECVAGGDAYCAALGKKCSEIPDGLCIECVSDMVCPDNGCYNGGEEYCTALGKQCTPTEAPQCVTCGPLPPPVCTGSECSQGGDEYCASFGKECNEVPSDLCIECVTPTVEPLPCSGGECAGGGDAFCAASGQTCADADNDICIQCSAPPGTPKYECLGNECRSGGAEYCGSFGKGCQNMPNTDTCIACKALGCKDSSECSFGSQCIDGSCVKTCGNGRLDAGEACDGGPGCTTTCLLDVEQQCTYDNECQTGRCENAKCDVCQGGNECQSGQCNAGTCLSLCGNGMLDAGEVCDPGPAGGNDTCTDACLLAEGGQCKRDADCQTGLCSNGQCIGCSRGSECASGICVSGSCIDLCGNGRQELLEQCDDGNRITGDGCSRFCELEGAGPVPTVASQLLPVSLIGDLPGGQNGQLGRNPDGTPIELEVGGLNAAITGHAAAGETGPAALIAIAGGAASGWAWMRRRRSLDRDRTTKS
jgi:virginiamycin B lyase